MSQMQELRTVIRKNLFESRSSVVGQEKFVLPCCRTTTLDPRGALLIARLILETIRNEHIKADAIGGLTLGADPIAAAVAVVSEIEGTPLNAFIVRKEAKGHGTQRFIEGYDGPKGARVIIVDDVCTTAGSLLKAAEKAEEAGYQVTATFCESIGKKVARVSRKNIPSYPLLTAKDLLKND
jgi:orotate phosphoribosyltransferase